MKDYDRNKESTYIKYWEENNLNDKAMQQKLPVNVLEWVENISEFHESFIKKYKEESDEGYFLGVDVQYPEKLHNFDNDLPFLPQMVKIGKAEKLIANLPDKTEYFLHTSNQKQDLNYELVLKKGTESD